MPFLVGVIKYAIGSTIARLILTLGLGVFTWAGISFLVESALDEVRNLLSGVPAQILDIVTIAGVPDAISVIGSALATMAAIKAMQTFVGFSP